jgi:hypothetical protein
MLLVFFISVLLTDIEVTGLPDGAYPCYIAETSSTTESALTNPGFPVLVIENPKYQSVNESGDYFYHFGERRLEWQSGPLKGWQTQVELVDQTPIIRFAATATAELEPSLSVGERYCTIPETLLDRFDYLW